MKFPGKRKSKHYFPVSVKNRIPFYEETPEADQVHVVGIDQLLVDIEANVDDSFLQAHGLSKGQSMVIDDSKVETLYSQLKREGRIQGEYAGGAIGNTLHNYSVLADDRSTLIGTITDHIKLGDYAFNYIRNTSMRVDLSYLHPRPGPMGRAICFITPDGERTFGISRGIMDELPPEAIPESVIQGASALVLTAFLLRNPEAPICRATLHAMELAKRHGVPVILSLGSEFLVRENRESLVKIIRDYVNIIAGNLEELRTLTGRKDPLLACRDALDFSDFVLLTRDRHGLYIAAWVDEAGARETKDHIHSKAIPEYNRYEYSRAMLRRDCQQPVKIFSHINPYHGGPSVIRNTNGAGDAALASLIHDMVANLYHRQAAPTSPKHEMKFFTYSSIHQICKYANRVSYEVLRRNSPRLMHGLPEREDSLEESYWAE